MVIALSPAAQLATLKLLHHSWFQIDFQYDHLTPQEKQCITRDEHQEIVAVIKSITESQVVS